MSRGGRWPANLATLANALVGVGSVLYTLAGNPRWAMLLIVAGVGFDGLDGLLARRSGTPPSAAGRVADSVADAITFGLAPAALLVVHTDHESLWTASAEVALLAATTVALLAIVRLVYFTVRGFRRSDFLGVPTPQNALAIVVVLWFLDVPAFATIDPVPALLLCALLAVPMVLPVEFPKIRRGSPLRGPMALTALAFVVAALTMQFRPAPGTAAYGLSELAAIVAAVGVAVYYLVGPFTVRRPREGVNAAT